MKLSHSFLLKYGILTLLLLFSALFLACEPAAPPDQETENP